MAKVLIVDDDQQLSLALESHLKSWNFTTDCAATGGDALQLLSTYSYEVIILDWHLPDISGFEVCVEYRKKGGQTPIIFLTGNDDINSLEKALDAGADDYIAKPFNIRELHARLKAILRRGTGEFNPVLSVGSVTLHPESGVVEVNGKSLILRNKEIGILEFLMRHTDSAFTAQDLLDAVWPADAAPTTSAVRVWMKYLREKLASIGAEGLISTEVGLGYIIRTNIP